MIDKDLILILLAVALGLFIFFYIKHKCKMLNLPSITLITGAPKTGKTLLNTYLAIKEYKKIHRKWFIKHIFNKDIEEPLFYTNASISFSNLKSPVKMTKNGEILKNKLDKNIVKLSLNSLLRLERFNYKSVIYIQELSLVADNMYYQNKSDNINMSLFTKLIAHETKGGKVFLDTQSILDTHYSFKRVCSTFLYIESSRNIFIGRLLNVRQLVNIDGVTMNNFNTDSTDTMKKVFVPFWYYKKYNCYEYSYITDHLPLVPNEPYKKDTLISFNKDYVKATTNENLNDKKGGVNNA